MSIQTEYIYLKVYTPKSPSWPFPFDLGSTANLRKGVTFKNYLRKGVYFVNIYAGGHFLDGTR